MLRGIVSPTKLFNNILKPKECQIGTKKVLYYLYKRIKEILKLHKLSVLRLMRHTNYWRT